MSDTRLHSYSSIYALGHAAAADVLADPVVVEEKIDGSQFSFGLLDGELCCRSKGKQLILDAPEKMFAIAVEQVRELHAERGLRPGYTYRAEYLQKPKHNSLCYARVPMRHLILFDVDAGLESYLSPEEKRAEAERLGLELAPVLFVGRIESLDAIKVLLAAESCLGGTAPEGLVIKNYSRFGADKKTLMAKYVTEAFKEVHAGEWKKANPTGHDVIQGLIAQYRSPARWQKAVQHLREAGQLEGSPRDIGPLFREVPADVLKECREEIMATLFAWAWPKVSRGITAGMPQWYKDELAQAAFAEVTP